ncbi:MAG: hypothetical protein ACKERF_01400 [Candidatus Hodgkinia cicadicola]
MKATTLVKRTNRFAEFTPNELTKVANSFISLRTLGRSIPTNELTFAMKHLFAKQTCSVQFPPPNVPKVYKLPSEGG